MNDLHRTPDGLIPLSDGAGEIVLLGDEVKRLAIGDRVAISCVLDYITEETTSDILGTGLGLPLDGVLTEYKAVPAHVSISSTRRIVV